MHPLSYLLASFQLSMPLPWYTSLIWHLGSPHHPFCPGFSPCSISDAGMEQGGLYIWGYQNSVLFNVYFLGDIWVCMTTSPNLYFLPGFLYKTWISNCNYAFCIHLADTLHLISLKIEIWSLCHTPTRAAPHTTSRFLLLVTLFLKTISPKAGNFLFMGRLQRYFSQFP